MTPVSDMSDRSDVSERSSQPFLARRMAEGIGAGLLFALCFPPYGVPVLLPVAVAALLVTLRRASVREALYTGFACGMAFYGATLFWLANLFGPAAISLVAIESLFPALFCLLFVWLRTRLPRTPAWMLSGILWVAIEYYRSELFVLNFGWMGLGYAAVHSRFFASCAAWVGSYGISFLIATLGAALTAAAGPTRYRPAAAAALAMWAGLLLVPTTIPAPAQPIHVRLVQAQPEDTDALFALSASARGSPADVVVWPEYSFLSDPMKDRRTWHKLEELVLKQRCCLIVGGKDETGLAGDAYRNTAYLLAPDGRLLGKHTKNHTVHLIRDGIPGTDARPIASPLGPLGVAICFDMDYPDVARRLAESGAVIFLVPNMDPPEWGPVQRAQHRLMFEMRAAECGRWLARADVAGGTSIVGPNGREVARVRTSAATSLDCQVGRQTGLTPYVRFGWLVPRLCLAVAIGFVVAAVVGSLPGVNSRAAGPIDGPSL